jgi:hypothetical protein
MAYTYHGKSTLIALPGESQRVINGNVIVIEKDYAIRKSELANVLADMAPGNKMPGTNYIIDTQPQFQIDDTGFARVRLSALNLDFASADEKANTNIISNRVDINGSHSIFSFQASFSFATGIFRYLRTAFSPSQDPNFPNIVLPVLLSAKISGNPSFETIFGPSKWVGTNVDKVNIYENRAFQYTVAAICTPEFIQMAGDDVLVRYDLTSSNGFFVGDPQNEFFQPFAYNIPAANGFYYKLTRVVSSAVTEYKQQEDLRNQIAALQKEFDQSWDFATRMPTAKTEAYTTLIANLKRQLKQ